MAHLFLSLDDPELMLGNFIADDIILSNIQYLPIGVQKGVALHRRIDTFTDQQPPWKGAVEMFRANHGRYSTVIVDIVNDHLLATSWDEYSNREFAEFEQVVYKNFKPMVVDLPPKAKIHVASLLEYEYLKAYESREGIVNVMSRMDKRTKFPSNFVASIDQLYSNLESFTHHFHELMSALQSVLPLLQLEVEKDFKRVL